MTDPAYELLEAGYLRILQNDKVAVLAARHFADLIKQYVGSATVSAGTVFVDSSDRFQSYLADKITTDNTIHTTVLNVGDNELLQITRPAITGDISIPINSNSATIQPNVVVYSKIQEVGADKLLGNPTGSTANVSEISLGTGLSFSGSTLIVSGFQPIGNYITALTGDVTATGPGSVPATISNHAVTYIKMQQASSSTLLGNPLGSIGNISEITIGSGLNLSVGGVLSATGGSGTVTAVTATAPLFSSGGTAPNLTIQGSIVSGSNSTSPQNLGLLTTGLLKGTVVSSTNTISTAVAGTDYQSPITWPTANEILVSAGPSTPPIGSAAFTYVSGVLNVGNSSTVGGIILQSTTGLGTAINFWKDSTPTRAGAIGNSAPGAAPTNDIYFSTYNGSAWTTQLIIAASGNTTVEGNLSIQGVTASNLIGVDSGHFVVPVTINLPLTYSSGTLGINVFGASGGGHSTGIVPDPGASAGSTRFVCENATWAVPTGDHKVMTDSGDANPDYLFNKIESTGGSISITDVSGGGGKMVNLNLDPSVRFMTMQWANTNYNGESGATIDNNKQTVWLIANDEIHGGWFQTATAGTDVATTLATNYLFVPNYPTGPGYANANIYVNFTNMTYTGSGTATITVEFFAINGNPGVNTNYTSLGGVTQNFLGFGQAMNVSGSLNPIPAGQSICMALYRRDTNSAATITNPMLSVLLTAWNP